MDNRPIGVFDSGLGGLTAVREIRAVLPAENIIYFGDTSRVPYGGRSRDILLRFARQDIHFLRSFDIKAILVACGTVSTTALPILQKENDLPVLGVVDPACRQAVRATRNHKIGMIATVASVRSGAYEAAIRALDPQAEVISKACPLFVPLVENGHYRVGDVAVEAIAREYLLPLKQQGIDTLIMGCTHYPLLRDVIAGIMGPDVALIDTGAEAARAIQTLLTEQDALCEKRAGRADFYASDYTEDFTVMAGRFLQQELDVPAARVDIEKF